MQRRTTKVCMIDWFTDHLYRTLPPSETVVTGPQQAFNTSGVILNNHESEEPCCECHTDLPGAYELSQQHNNNLWTFQVAIFSAFSNTLIQHYLYARCPSGDNLLSLKLTQTGSHYKYIRFVSILLKRHVKVATPANEQAAGCQHHNNGEGPPITSK